MEPRQQIRQAAGRGALHRSDAEKAGRFGGVDHLPRLRHQIQNATGLGHKSQALACQGHSFAVPAEERYAEILFEPLDPRRHVRRHTRQGLRGARYAALRRDGAEDMEIR